MPRDSVDALLASWAHRRPEHDFSPVAVMTRLARVRRHLDVELDGVFAAYGLEPATFALLATLDRLDPAGDGVSRARVMAELGLPAAALDAAFATVSEAGLVTPVRDGYTLSEGGREVMDAAVPAHLANADRLLSALSEEDRETLAEILRRLLVEFEGSRPAGGAAGPIGLTLMPAHVTAELRAAVELPPATGLLVRGVDRGSAAARAGLRHGDILISAGGRALRAITDLYEALGSARGSLDVRALRGSEPLAVTLEVEGPPPAAASPGRASYAEHVV